MTGLYGCYTIGVIYMISCLKCKKQYVGQTGRDFYLRGMEHLRSVRAGEKTIGMHFSSNCKNDDLKIYSAGWKEWFLTVITAMKGWFR